MTYKTILVHCDASKSVTSRLDVAVGLARHFNAHLVALHARPPFQPPAFVEGGMDLLLDDYEENLKTGQTAAAAAFTNAIEGKQIASQWRAVDGSADSTLIAHARYADLVIVGQNDPDTPTVLPAPSDLPETVALSTGRAVLVVPHIGVEKTPGGTVMLCWNASREAARAASADAGMRPCRGRVKSFFRGRGRPLPESDRRAGPLTLCSRAPGRRRSSSCERRHVAQAPGTPWHPVA